MSSDINPYCTEPAIPVLAHTLLQLPEQPPGTSDAEGDSGSGYNKPEPNSLDAWNLKPSIENGLQHYPNDIFRPGTVLGFSRLRGRSPDGNDDEFIGETPRYLLTKWLCKVSSAPHPRNKAFIIHPANFDAFSPKKLLASLLSLAREPALSRNEAISCLDSVQLFPVFDLAAAAQAITEVSGTLHSLWEHPEDQWNHAHPEPEPARKGHATVLIITGLDTLAESVIRASNAVRGAAVLTSIIRTITQLSRTHRSNLSVMLVNTSGVGPMAPGGFSGAQDSQFRREDENQQFRFTREDGINSIFRVADASLFPSLLMRTVEQGIDTHFLLSYTRSIPVVEVIKDRLGNNVGKWCAWDRKK
ncbi:hypothetical protein ARAM_001910 [Aspergillus rambellii]|uniref:Uncharacterized protein n=1 Tax=Aspergillus rambellii TaxID=308745 RepID=A0A0F8WBR5_9EURO|nr:hypothetical protein ARAM_001910 [Aspergillus rambellii]